MSIRVIAFGMVFILVALFVFLRIMEKSLKKKSRLEAFYADAVFKFKENPSESSYTNCIKSVSSILDLNAEDAERQLKKDGISYNN